MPERERRRQSPRVIFISTRITGEIRLGAFACNKPIEANNEYVHVIFLQVEYFSSRFITMLSGRETRKTLVIEDDECYFIGSVRAKW